MTPVWWRTLKTLLTTGRRPSERRLRIWRARAAFERAARALGPGDVAVDCGANVGRYTAALARSGATVHAFEPDPVAFETLSKRLGGLANVILHDAAVGVGEGRVTLFRSEDFAADPLKRTVSSSVIAEKANVDDATAVVVRQIDLPAFLDGLSRVGVLKIDIEGAEVPILERLLESGLLARIGAVFVETHEGKIPSLAPRMAALRAAIARQGLSNVNLDWA